MDGNITIFDLSLKHALSEQNVVPFHPVDVEIDEQTDSMDSPLAALCSTAQCTRGNHAWSDELKGDKKGLRDGGGLKK